MFGFKFVFLSMWLLTLNGCLYHLWKRLCDVCWFRSFFVRFDLISFVLISISKEFGTTYVETGGRKNIT